MYTLVHPELFLARLGTGKHSRAQAAAVVAAAAAAYKWILFVLFVLMFVWQQEPLKQCLGASRNIMCCWLLSPYSNIFWDNTSPYISAAPNPIFM